MKPEALQTIDLTTLAQVSGGRSSDSGGSSDTAIMTALSGILDSLGSLASSRQSGMSAQDMMLFMMLMQQRSAPAISTPHAPAPTWTWDANGGYWIVK